MLRYVCVHGHHVEYELQHVIMCHRCPLSIDSMVVQILKLGGGLPLKAKSRFNPVAATYYKLSGTGDTVLYSVAIRTSAGRPATMGSGI